MKSAWYSIRAFVTIISVLGAGGTLAYLALQGSKEALIALVATLSAVITYYFASPTGAGGNPRAPTT